MLRFMFVVIKLDVVNKNASLLKLFKIDQSKTKNFECSKHGYWVCYSNTYLKIGKGGCDFKDNCS